jgi:NADH:ubiquinone oxidoreductase subunit D
MSRSVGIKRDLRLSRLESYSSYPSINFRSFIGERGDCYDRFLIRMYEMIESLNILNQVSKKFEFFENTITDSNKLYDNFNMSSYISKKIHNHNITMENTITEFKSWSEDFVLDSHMLSRSIESPKGEFSVFIVSDNTNKPYKLKVRSPAYHNMQSCPKISKGHFLADLVTIIGTVDIVFGEIDR